MTVKSKAIYHKGKCCVKRQEDCEYQDIWAVRQDPVAKEHPNPNKTKKRTAAGQVLATVEHVTCNCLLFCFDFHAKRNSLRKKTTFSSNFTGASSSVVLRNRKITSAVLLGASQMTVTIESFSC